VGLRGTRQYENGENYIMRSLMVCTHTVLIKSIRMWWAGHVARVGRVEMYTGFWWGNLKERAHLEEPGVGGRIILRWILRKWVVRSWTGSLWLRVGTGGGHL